MASGDFGIVIHGLKELRDSINPNRINKQIAISVGLFATKLHSELKFGIVQVYKTNRNLDTVLVGRTSETAQFGKNVIRGGLVYKFKPIDLAKFSYSSEMGNINAGAKRKGPVHTVTVRRGSPKIVYGKSRHGGFAAPNRKNPQYGTQMFERVGKPRNPLRILFGPSLSTMALRVATYNPTVKAHLDNFDTFIAERLEL